MNIIPNSNKKETFILVMPAYNEAKNIKNSLNSWAKVIYKHPDSEILVLDDGSQDDTYKISKEFATKHKFVKVLAKTNEGHGKTIMLGYHMAIRTKHEWIFQADSDGQILPTDFNKLWAQRRKSSFIMGYRFRRRDPSIRLIMSNFISLTILLLFNKKIRDLNIPFRLIKRGYLINILKKVPDDVFAPNIFLSILASYDGKLISNIPVRHYKPKHKSSLVNTKLLKSYIQGFVELIKFRIIING